MDGSNRRMGNVNRRTATGMVVCIAGLCLMFWVVLIQVPAGHSLLLFVALPLLVALGLLVAGFALMVAGAEPFEDDSGGVRDTEQPH